MSVRLPAPLGSNALVFRMRSLADCVSRLNVLWFLIPLLLNAASLAEEAAPPALKMLYNQHQWFALRDATKGKATPLLYQGAVAAAFNQNEEAERYLAEIIKRNPASDDAEEAHEILSKLYARSGRYKDALYQLDELRRVRPNRADVENVRTLFAAWSKYPDQSIPKATPARVRADVRKDGVKLPVVIHGKTAHWLFDTGFNFCMMSESEAKTLGISIDEASSKVSDSAGGTTTMRTAVVDEMAVGSFHLRNVAFLIMPDEQEPMSDWQPGERGIIGLPVALAFQSFSWRSDGIFEIRPETRKQPAHRNLCLDGLSAIVRVNFEGKPLDFAFDTGDQAGTQLWQRFADDFPALLAERGSKGNQKVDQVGGANDRPTTVLPEVTLQVGGLDTTLRPAQVFSKPAGDEFHHGLLGMDVLSQAREVRVDFGSMKLELAK